MHYKDILDFIYETPWNILRKNLYKQYDDLVSKGYPATRIYLGVNETKTALQFINSIHYHQQKSYQNQFEKGDMLAGLKVIPVKFKSYCMVGA
jgi:hypothetical protein